jgi:chloramphenicol 3-O phosphotransferase
MELPRLILLNGVSSSGKTSIAHLLQERLDILYLNFSIDSVLYALPPSDLRAMMEGRKIAREEYKYTRLVRGFHAAVAGLLATGNRLIVDNALTREDWRMDFDAAVAPYNVVRIGVLCELSVARQREFARGDRAVGTAEAEFPLAHVDMAYDLTVDTSFSGPDKAASVILDWLRTDHRHR